jgi:hypothetical protein
MKKYVYLESLVEGSARFYLLNQTNKEYEEICVPWGRYSIAGVAQDFVFLLTFLTDFVSHMTLHKIHF